MRCWRRSAASRPAYKGRYSMGRDVISAIALAIFLTACASTQTMPVDEVARRLNGAWQVDTHASDNLRDRLLPLFKAREAKWRKDADRYLPPPSEERGAPTVDWLLADRRRAVEELIARLTPATELQITASTREVRVKGNKGEGTRVLNPGQTSALILPQGRFKLSSLWDKGMFVIDMRGDDNKLRVTEHVAPIENGMEIRMVASIPEIGKQ